MKNVVLGTAGHIDHGKTALVKRLTGIDTDRLEEEKRRGMTIELGFAPLILPSGNEISIIDVPGHEKFVKTMVAGVTGIDFVMLVVAADEGIMPQTKEHIDILSLLNVNKGVVALTKTDLVDEEWLGMVSEDIKKALNGTTLEKLPIIPVSSLTGDGMDNLVEALEQLALTASESSAQELFRLPVDRVFTMTGHGTVITGTVLGGRISKGEAIEILPGMLPARIRGIQVHNRAVEAASAGDRCALNLSGIERDEIKRGDIAAAQGVLKPVLIADAVINIVDGIQGIAHNQRVHVHIGTKEVLARLRVLGADEIAGGSKGYVQLRFEEPVAVLRGDRFIIRTFSPVMTIGGGWILYHFTKRRQRFSEESMEALSVGELGTLKDLVSFIIENNSKILSSEDIWRQLYVNKEALDKILKELDTDKVIYLKSIDKYISRRLFNEVCEKINAEFDDLYKKYPYRYQIDREEIKSKYFNEAEAKDFAEILNLLINEGQFNLDGKFIVQKNKAAENRILARRETAIVENAISEAGFNLGSIQKLNQSLNIDENILMEIVKFLIKTGRVIDMENGLLIQNDVLKKAVYEVRNILSLQGSATAAQVRDTLGIGRKAAIALLEYLDSIEITQRFEEIRKPGVHFMDFFR